MRDAGPSDRNHPLLRWQPADLSALAVPPADEAEVADDILARKSLLFPRG
jgi:hypothetical protein